MWRLISLHHRSAPVGAALAALAFASIALLLFAGLLPRAPRVGALHPPGIDALSVTGLVTASSRLGSETIVFSGTITIQRGDPYLDLGVEVVDTQIVAMNLSGQSVTGPVTISQSQTLPSLGEIRSLQPPPDEFPASSFFDVFIDVVVPASPSGPLTVHNDVALHMVPFSAGADVPLNSWPPTGVLYYAEPNPPGGSGAQPQTWPPGEPHCTSGERLLPSFPAKICIDSISILFDGTQPTPTNTPPPATPTPCGAPGPTCTPTPTPTVTPTPTPKDPAGDTDGDTIPNGSDLDDDNDGCSDLQELGPDEHFGGLRDPHSFWDFFDVWTHPLGQPTVWVRDKVVNVPGDIIGVASRFGPGTQMGQQQAYAEAFTPPTSDNGYHPAFDRGPQTGPNRWDASPPDGAVNIPDDILGVAAQFGHTCE